MKYESNLTQSLLKCISRLKTSHLKTGWISFQPLRFWLQISSYVDLLQSQSLLKLKRKPHGICEMQQCQAYRIVSTVYLINDITRFQDCTGAIIVVRFCSRRKQTCCIAHHASIQRREQVMPLSFWFKWSNNRCSNKSANLANPYSVKRVANNHLVATKSLDQPWK